MTLSRGLVDTQAGWRNMLPKWKNPSGTPTYGAWVNARNRCLNPKNAQYKDYGGRGITICKRWIDNYDAFYTDMGPVPDGMTLERIDNDQGYDPFNCVWASRKDQAANRRKAERKHYSPHGSRKRYERYACRCDLCKRANADYAKQQRQRRKVRDNGRVERQSCEAGL
jgi:hypothetical protein